MMNLQETPTVSVNGGMSQNHDRAESKNYSLSVTKGAPGNSVKGTAFVNSLTEGGANKSVGGNLAFEKPGVGGQVGAVHSSNFKQLSTSGHMNVVNTDNHKLNVNAFAQKNMPKNHPSFVTHGKGVNYMYKDTVGASASVSHTPMFNQTTRNVGATMNLHQTPTSNMSLNLGASKTTTPHHHGNWEKNAFFNVQKRF